jgi:hypothetical protein
MAFEGDELSEGSPILAGLRLTDVEAVLVSGDSPNVYGHALVHCTGGTDAYFHVIGDPDSANWKYIVGGLAWGLGSRITGKPRYMDGAGYSRYLSETGKTEWGRIAANLTNAGGASSFLKKRCLETWFWGAVAHNCMTFVRKVITEGSGTQPPGDSDLPSKVAKAAGILP